MIGVIAIALLNGGFIGLCRTLNGRLSQDRGPFTASFYNHLVGALILTLVVVIIGLSSNTSSSEMSITNQHWTLYLGGVIGALYVVINSHIMTQIGALKATLLVISGQMLTGVMLGLGEQPWFSTLMQFVGVALIIVGIYLCKKMEQT